MSRTIWFCDDEPSVRRVLEQQLRIIEKELGEIFDLRAFSSGEDLLREYTPDVNIVLLDIELKDGISGMDAARRLRLISDDFYLIFISSHDEYALEGYEVHAFSFIKKPIIHEQLKRNLKLVFSKLDAVLQNEKKIVLQDKNSRDVYQLDRILYFEVFSHTTRVVSLGKATSYNISLSSVEQLIGETRYFFRCHKSYLINLKYVSKINTNDITMQDGSIIPLSKHRKQDFLVTFAMFSGGLL